ncbi:MAG: pilus assembly protein [Bacillota bacterium]|nr:pilus assembly protein [Bacillota bacterium]
MAGRRGSVTAEFVLILGVLTTVLFLTVELGMALNVRLLVASAAREGARRAAIDGGDTPGARQAIARQLGLTSLIEEEAEVDISPASASYGTMVTVSVRVAYRWRTPVARSILGHGVILRGEAASRSEKVRTGT